MKREPENSTEQIKNLYSNIHRILKQRGLKWKDLAVMIGISAKTLSSMKSQNQVPGVLTVKRIADLLDVSMDELFDTGEKTQALYDLYWEIPRILKDPDIQRISCIQMKYIANAVANGPDENRPLSRDEFCRKEVHDRLSEMMSESEKN